MKTRLIPLLFATALGATPALTETCVGPTFDVPFPGASEVRMRYVDVPAAQFPGSWQEGMIDGQFYQIFANKLAVLQDGPTAPAWSINVNCQVSPCTITAVGSPPATALPTAISLEQCLVPTEVPVAETTDPVPAELVAIAPAESIVLSEITAQLAPIELAATAYTPAESAAPANSAAPAMPVASAEPTALSETTVSSAPIGLVATAPTPAEPVAAVPAASNNLPCEPVRRKASPPRLANDEPAFVGFAPSAPLPTAVKDAPATQVRVKTKCAETGPSLKAAKVGHVETAPSAAETEAPCDPVKKKTVPPKLSNDEPAFVGLAPSAPLPAVVNEPSVAQVRVKTKCAETTPTEIVAQVASAEPVVGNSPLESSDEEVVVVRPAVDGQLRPKARPALKPLAGTAAGSTQSSTTDNSASSQVTALTKEVAAPDPSPQLKGVLSTVPAITCRPALVRGSHPIATLKQLLIMAGADPGNVDEEYSRELTLAVLEVLGYRGRNLNVAEATEAVDAFLCER